MSTRTNQSLQIESSDKLKWVKARKYFEYFRINPNTTDVQTPKELAVGNR